MTYLGTSGSASYKLSQNVRFTSAPAARLPVLAAAEIYGALLDKVRENGYDNHTRRAYTTTGEKLAKLPGLVARAWFAR